MNKIICLKHGTKYGPDYVNILHSMIKRFCTVEHEFICFTEDKAGLVNDIKVVELPTAYPKISGWWYKPLLMNPLLPQLQHSTVLYIDLDVIIFKNIDKLFHYKPGSFCVVRDFNRSTNKDWNRFNSSVVRWQTGQHPQVYNEFIKDAGHTARRFHGDQDWLFANVKNNFEFWPDEWIMSYKWEMRGRPPLIRRPDGIRDFKAAGHPTIHGETSIAVFHGDPNPKVCSDPWCKENWK